MKDTPKLAAGVVLRDVTFYSEALQREETYRVYFPEKIAAGALPEKIAPDARLPVVFLLHGADDNYRSWSNKSDVAQFAAAQNDTPGMVLVMPDGGKAYYVNSAGDSRDRYEDFLVNDLRADVEKNFPVSQERAGRAIVGISRGGYGAIVLALKHPDLYSFAGSLSGALDIPERAFSFRRPLQSLTERKYLGPAGSETRRANDPFALVRSVDRGLAPFMMLTCGEQDSLMTPNREFVVRLAQLHLKFLLHTTAGGHDWTQWDQQVPVMFAEVMKRVR